MADASPFAPPSAALTPEQQPRFAHAIAAGISAFVVLAVFTIYLVLSGDGQTTFNEPGDFLAYGIFLICSIAAALAVLPWRNLRWYWAVAIGPLLAFPMMIATVWAIASLGPRFGV